MLRSIIILLISLNSLGAQQLIVVLAQSSHAQMATLQRYEKQGSRYQKVSHPIAVNLGRNGLRLKKREGDGTAPEGIFELGAVFAYDNIDSKMPFIHATHELICIDDVTHKNYNQLTTIKESPNLKSFEFMRRHDNLYKYGIIIKHNPHNKVPYGSCVFMHIEKEKNSPTAGCTSMSEKNLLDIINWLDITKKPKILQTTQEDCHEFVQDFPGVHCK